MPKQVKKLVFRAIIYISAIILAYVYMILCKNGLGISCFYKNHFNIQCISCGATRAFIAICHFDFTSAISYHPIFALFIYPTILIVTLQDFIICIVNAYRKINVQSLITYVFSCMLTSDGRKLWVTYFLSLLFTLLLDF